MTTRPAAIWLFGLALGGCSLETPPLQGTDAGPLPPHHHDWSDLTGPAQGTVGLGTSEPSAVLHLRGTLSRPLTGTVSVLAGTSAVTGAGTFFTQELQVGDAISVAGEAFTVTTITDDETLTLDGPHQAGASSVIASADPQLLLEADTGAGMPRLMLGRDGRLGARRTVVAGLTTLPTDLMQSWVNGVFVNDDPHDVWGEICVGSKEDAGYAGSAITWGYIDSDDTWQSLFEADGEYVNSGANRVWSVYDNIAAASRLAIDEDGQVGLGIRWPQRALHIQNRDPLILFDSTQSGEENWIIGPDSRGWVVFNDTDGEYRLVVDNDGNVGIGTQLPGSALEVNGCITGSFCSDARLKTDIHPLSGSVLERLARLRATTYHWKNDPTRNPRIGLIAQEVEKVFPEVVTARDDGEQKGLSCTGLNAIAIQAINELRGENQQLERANQDLRAELAAQDHRLRRLETILSRSGIQSGM